LKILTINLFAVGLFLSACNNLTKVSNDKETASIIIQENKLKQLFADWQVKEIKAGHYWATDSCNPQWFSKHKIKETPNDIKFGFPSDSSEYQFSFADLNNDGILDGLIVFIPDQCDGGNIAGMNQIQVFLLSGKSNYNATDTLQVGKFDSTNFDSLGFYWLDSIGNNRIYGVYHEYKDTDFNWRPSVNRPVLFNFIDRKLISVCP
jgi:hypothetical protein